jgi:hypothetical protein
MGTAPQLVQERVDQTPSPSDWVLFKKGAFKLFRNRHTREEVEEYTFMPSGQLTYA